MNTRSDFISHDHILDAIDVEKASSIIRELISLIQDENPISEQRLSNIIAKANKDTPDEISIGKRHLAPVMDLMSSELADTPEDVLSTLRKIIKVKPSRTVSGVATVSLLTRPAPCRGNCSFCPNDLRMPKSYLYDEPACMRAERCHFDPYVQVISRMGMLTNMGHDIDKIEILILGSTWHDYPKDYRIWFCEQVFEAVNDFGTAEASVKVQKRKEVYRIAGFPDDLDQLELEYAPYQSQVDSLSSTYAQAFRQAYKGDSPIARRWKAIERFQTATWEGLFFQQELNEDAPHRVVGLSVETRPDAVDVSALADLRRIGVTKIQIGIQSTDDGLLSRSFRNLSYADMKRAIELARSFGFKLHLHFMANLPGSTLAKDKEDFARFIEGDVFCPDELKIYPCSLIAGTSLMAEYESGQWSPYTQDELEDLLCHDLSLVKPYTRVSRVIRDFNTDDIVAGNKTVNLRQIASDKMVSETGERPVDIRSREVKKISVDVDALSLDRIDYDTSNTSEVFLQFVDDEDHIAAFLRLSFPDKSYVECIHETDPAYPIDSTSAMIREVHVYGTVSTFSKNTGSVQHRGLGTKLVKEAIRIARERGCEKISVISSVGTRKYYERFGFELDGLYQTLVL